MPLIQIYACTVCSTTLRVDFGAAVPQHCGAPMKWRQTREYKPEEHGWSTGQRAPAIGFRHTNPWVIPVEDAHGAQMEVSSLREIRRLEKESEKMAADGVGQEMRFRAFNQDCKNGGLLVNSFGEPPHRKPQLFDSKGRQRISFEAVDGEPVDADELGPGTDEQLMSALPEAP